VGNGDCLARARYYRLLSVGMLVFLDSGVEGEENFAGCRGRIPQHAAPGAKWPVSTDAKPGDPGMFRLTGLGRPAAERTDRFLPQHGRNGGRWCVRKV